MDHFIAGFIAFFHPQFSDRDLYIMGGMAAVVSTWLIVVIFGGGVVGYYVDKRRKARRKANAQAH